MNIFLTKQKKRISWGLFLDNILVSIADLNAKALDLGQVGGVYTTPSFRQKGCSRSVMRQLLLIEEIHKTTRTQKNLKDYYECKNKRIENKIKRLKKEVNVAKTKTNSSFFWYLKENPHKRVSVNERLLAVLPHTGGFQRLPLRDYDEAFSKMSTSLHPNNSFDESTIYLKHLELSLTRLGILFMHVILP